MPNDTTNKATALTLTQLAERWQTSVEMLKRMISRGTLKAIDINLGGPVRIVRVPLAAIEAAEQGLAIEPATPRKPKRDAWEGVSDEVRELVEGMGTRRRPQKG